MSSFRFQSAQPIVSNGTRPGEAPFDWQHNNLDPSDSSTSFSGISDGFDQYSSLFDDDGSSSSRESSPALEVIYQPDASYMKEAAARAQEASAAPSADITHNINPEIVSPDDIETDDELWNELMGIPTNEASEPQLGQAAPALELASHDPEDEDDDDEMIAMMTASLETELAETQQAEKIAAEKQAAEAVLQKNALLKEQLRVAAESEAQATQFNDLLGPPKKKFKSATIQRDVGRAGLVARMDRIDLGVYFDSSANAAARHVQKEATAKPHNPGRDPVAVTVAPEPAPEPNFGERTPSNATPSNASPSVESTYELSRAYHRTDCVDWRQLLERLHLTTNLDTKACYQSLGLDPVRGQELSNKLRDHLRIPGNSVNVSRDTGTHKTKQIIAQVAHELLCNQLWGETYFNRPHVECGYSNVKFEADSTSILIEFSRLLYKVVKAEERRKKSNLRNQQKRDAKNAEQHPVATEFAPAPAICAPPSNFRQEAAPQLSLAQPVFAQPVPAQPVSSQPVFEQSIPAPERQPVMDYTMFMSIYGGRC